MKILITSGGTSEKIDQVRSITNHASGNLGKIIAELFLQKGHQVTLVTTKSAVKPQAQAGLDINIVTDVASLAETLEPLVKTHQVLIHSMAVSDYTPVYMTDLAELQASYDVSQFFSFDSGRLSQHRICTDSCRYNHQLCRESSSLGTWTRSLKPIRRIAGFHCLTRLIIFGVFLRKRT